jgi:hypothetical protein
MDWQKIIAASAIAGAVVTLTGLAWAFGDDSGYRPIMKREFIGFISKDFKMAQDTTQQLIKSVQWLELENLEKLYLGGVLTDQEKQKRCLLAYQLQAFFTKDCTWPAPLPVTTQ